MVPSGPPSSCHGPECPSGCFGAAKTGCSCTLRVISNALCLEGQLPNHACLMGRTQAILGVSLWLGPTFPLQRSPGFNGESAGPAFLRRSPQLTLLPSPAELSPVCFAGGWLWGLEFYQAGGRAQKRCLGTQGNSHPPCPWEWGAGMALEATAQLFSSCPLAPPSQGRSQCLELRPCQVGS